MDFQNQLPSCFWSWQLALQALKEELLPAVATAAVVVAMLPAQAVEVDSPVRRQLQDQRQHHQQRHVQPHHKRQHRQEQPPQPPQRKRPIHRHVTSLVAE